LECLEDPAQHDEERRRADKPVKGIVAVWAVGKLAQRRAKSVRLVRR
jgi:hypothetical protein